MNAGTERVCKKSHRKNEGPVKPRKRVAFLLFGLLLPAFIAVNCASHSIRTFETDGLRSQAYVDALSRNTRHVSLYHHFETRLLLDATLWTDDFKEAWFQEYARVYGLNAEQRAGIEEDFERDWGEGVRIRVCLHANSMIESNLTPDRGIWRVTLLDDQGHEATAKKILRVGDAELLEKRFFPYISKLGRTYDLFFPAQSSTGTSFAKASRLVLKLSGVPGTAQVEWDVKPAPSSN